MYTKDTKSTAGNDLHDDIRLIKEKVCETRDAISQTAWDVKECATDAFSDAKDRAATVLNRSLSEAQHKTAQIKDEFADYLDRNPIKTLVFAGLAGVVLAQLLRKK